MMGYKFLQIFIVLFLVTACSEKEENIEDMPADTLYSKATQYLEQKEFSKAAKTFEEVERQHPYSNLALKSQLMQAYCYYATKKYDEAIEGLKTFVQLHPGHPEVDYAHYMIGLCYYEKIPIIERDQQPAKDALESFKYLVSRFPKSRYTKDAGFKITFIYDHLAAKEMYIGRYYQKRGGHLAAINHFKEVVNNYQTTSQVPEALYRLTECYLPLKLKKEAHRNAAILGHNFPNSEWYRHAYELITKFEKK
ncbi:MAG: outer membrane protein assembly factor BamD [Alphaproteobacteria bacterium]